MTPGWAPAGYVSMVKQWHAPAAAPESIDGSGRPRLVLYAVNRGDRIELEATTDAGDFAPLDIDRASAMFRCADGNVHPVDPRTLNLVYQLQRHFAASEVRFLSGYRTPHGGRSFHGLGRAVDLVIPGATDEQVVAFARAQGFVGTGIYPTSGFVHVDARDRSFFWVDRSGPGQTNRTMAILAAEAAARDAQARAAGKVPPPPTTIGRDVDVALAARAKAVVEAQSASARPTAATYDDGAEMDEPED
jgi:uncharacterized protein YcbK (DUF882 family)